MELTDQHLKKLYEAQKESMNQLGYFMPPLLESFLVFENWKMFKPEELDDAATVANLKYALELIRDLAIEVADLKLQRRPQ